MSSGTTLIKAGRKKWLDDGKVLSIIHGKPASIMSRIGMGETPG